MFLFIQSTFWPNEIIKELSENGTLNFCINHNILDCSTLSVLIFHVLKNIERVTWRETKIAFSL